MNPNTQPAKPKRFRATGRLLCSVCIASLMAAQSPAEVPLNSLDLLAAGKVSSKSISPSENNQDALAPGLPSITEITDGRAAALFTNSLVPSRKRAAVIPPEYLEFVSQTNEPPREGASREQVLTYFNKKLDAARYFRQTYQPKEAEPLLAELLGEASTEGIRQNALLELAACAQDENDLPRAQQIYAQFLSKWNTDLRVPEILFRQGLLYRRMGLNNMALTKFYGVMTSALVLKNDQLEYYIRLVAQAQIEIAETHYALGKYAEAAEFFTRLLKQTNSFNRTRILYKLARCHYALGKYADTVADAQDFLAQYPTAPEQTEIRFQLAMALKALGRDNEALQQVLHLMEEQRDLGQSQPAVWAYWQQRAGNLIANYLYRDGDYTKALQVYLDLAKLDSSLSWQLPVQYQIGMTYEKLWQPKKALDTYAEILQHEKSLGENPPPSLKTVLDMARWRIGFLEWQTKAELTNRELGARESELPVAASLPGAPQNNP